MSNLLNTVTETLTNTLNAPSNTKQAAQATTTTTSTTTTTTAVRPASSIGDPARSDRPLHERQDYHISEMYDQSTRDTKLDSRREEVWDVRRERKDETAARAPRGLGEGPLDLGGILGSRGE